MRRGGIGRESGEVSCRKQLGRGICGRYLGGRCPEILFISLWLTLAGGSAGTYAVAFPTIGLEIAGIIIKLNETRGTCRIKT